MGGLIRRHCRGIWSREPPLSSNTTLHQQERVWGRWMQAANLTSLTALGCPTSLPSLLRDSSTNQNTTLTRFSLITHQSSLIRLLIFNHPPIQLINIFKITIKANYEACTMLYYPIELTWDKVFPQYSNFLIYNWLTNVPHRLPLIVNYSIAPLICLPFCRFAIKALIQPL